MAADLPRPNDAGKSWLDTGPFAKLLVGEKIAALVVEDQTQSEG
jgi:hypothetical protein